MDNAVSERRGETTRLGSFEIVRKLARGGMAEIFLARTRGPSGFEKLVVLKKILPKYAGKPRFVQLFLDEAKLAATLDHPNIAQVYDIGIVDGSYFFTMEYLHGQDVRSVLHRTWRTGARFPIADAVQIARHVASALHFAHDKRHGDGTLLGIVHRDVSPSNIIVTYDGATKLLDFGVAKTTASSVKTRTGALKGKISYMSPEQARGAPIDRRSDIFSLGIVLWEMVTTQRLYRGENDLATLQLIITQPPRPPSTVRPDCPPELERIVLRALAQDPDARYATAAELVTELDELAREHKLKQSSNALAETLGQLFGAELAAWREARAAGVPLADHLHDAGDMTTPVSESDFIEFDLGLDDEDDDDDEVEVEDDDEKTEHAAPIHEAATRAVEPVTPADPVTALSPLVEPLAGSTVPFAAARSHATPSSAYAAVPPPVHASRSGPIAVPQYAHASPSGPTAAVPQYAPASPSGPTAAPRHAHATPSGPSAAAPQHAHATPSGPIAAVPQHAHATPSAPFASVAPPAPHNGSAPFAVPPWHSGQPAPAPATPSDRIARSWATIDLPAFDPEAFERHRRIAYRIAGGLLGAIFLIAIVAGRC